MTVTLADPYLSQNEGRRYPLADDSVGLSDASIVDFRCSVRDCTPGTVPSATVASISAATAGGRDCMRITVRLTAGGSHRYLAFDIPRDIAPAAPFPAYAETAGAVGSLTVTAAVLGEKEGTYDVPFAANTVVADDLKVDSVQSAESVESTDPKITHNPTVRLTKGITIVDGFNTEPYLDGNRLRINVTKGGGVGEWCQTAGSGQTCENVLFTINGEKPGSDGNIELRGEGGVHVTPLPEEHALAIELDDVAADRMLGTCGTACGKEA